MNSQSNNSSDADIDWTAQSAVQNDSHQSATEPSRQGANKFKC